MTFPSCRWVLGASVAALVAGCGGRVLEEEESAAGGGAGGSDGGGGTGGETTTSSATTTTTWVAPGDVTPACLDYCDALVPEKLCFDLEDCHARCMSLYVPGCASEVEAVLACLPEWLSEDCQIGHPTNLQGCAPFLDALWGCGVGALGNCQSIGTQLVGDTACSGDASCGATQIAIECDAEGQCACVEDGMAIGECSMPFTGTEACSPTYSCCHAFF